MTGEKPVRACGCIIADDEAAIGTVLALLRALVRESGGTLALGGFGVESVVKNDDGSVTTRRLTL